MAEWDVRIHHLLIFKNNSGSNKEQQMFSRQATKTNHSDF